MTVRVGTAWAACRWPDSERSHAAWEVVMRDPGGVSCWRYAYPADPPHQGYVVVVLGENHQVVGRHMETLLTHGGQPWTIEDDQLEALRLRRLRQAVHAATTGETYQIRQGIADMLDPTGQMTPANRAARRKRKRR